MTAQPLLEVRNLEVTYKLTRGRFCAVRDINFSVNEGEALGIVGESGSGKSTIGRAVLGLADATAGTITFDGADITHLSRRGRQRISQDLQVVFQDPRSSLNEAKRIRDILTEPLVTNGQMRKSEAIERAATLLARVGLDRDALDRLPDNFSGGQRQRIAIARAFMPSPRLVICDEPVSALDLSVQAQIMNLFLRERQETGVTYLFIAHNLAVVRFLCERVVVMSGGRIVEVGRTEDVYSAPKEDYTKKLLAAEPHPDPAVQRRRRKAWIELTEQSQSVSVQS
jgi:ABC-type oligopeptide transport system ATPase subunit